MSISPLRQNLNHLTHKRLAVGILALLLNMLLLSVGSLFTPVYAVRAAPAPSWSIFHDPVYGFSIQYPSVWTLMPESDGSHITLFNPATRSSMSPIVTTQQGTPSAVLKQALSVTGAKNLTVAGHQAVSSLTPYVPVPPTKNQDAALPGGPQQIRQVIMPVTNSTNSTNVYLFRLTQSTDAKGKLSTAVQTDQITFETMLNSFTLPVKVISVARPAKAASATGRQKTSMSGCDRTCWADDNWNYNYYDDSSGPYSFACDVSAYQYSYSTRSDTCIDGNIYGAQVASSGQYYQPNFQCADFVSRALTQDGLTSLNNGGVSGFFPATSPFGGYDPYIANNGSSYNLLNVGNASDLTQGVVGLSNYLLDNGLATNIHRNVSQAVAGDVVFFFVEGNSGPYEHTMIITSISGNQLVLDGHNIAQYHLVTDTTGLDIYHLTSVTSGGSGGTPPPSNSLSPSPTVINEADGTHTAFDVDKNGQMWLNTEKSGSHAWWGWQWFNGGANFVSSPAVVSESDGTNTLLAIDNTGLIWVDSESSAHNWWGWQWFGTNNENFISMTPTVINEADGTHTVFAVDKNGQMWLNTEKSGSHNWWGWQWFSGSENFVSSPAVVSESDGTNTLLAIDNTGLIWVNSESSAHNWWGWQWFGTNNENFISAPPTVINEADGTHTVFAVDKNGQMWLNTEKSGSHAWWGWQWFNGGANFVSSPAVVSESDGTNTLLAIDNTGLIWVDSESSAHNWWGWQWFGTNNENFSNAVPAVLKELDGTHTVFEVDKNGQMWLNTEKSGSHNWWGWQWFDANENFVHN